MFQEFNRESFPKVVVHAVSQNTYTDKIIRPSNKDVHLFHTHLRAGCDAVLLLTIKNDGTEHVTLTHFDPKSLDEHLQVITRTSISHPQGKKLAILLTRGYDQVSWLKNALRTFLKGKYPDVISLSHLDSEHVDELSSVSFNLNYQLCFTIGYQGDLQKHKISVPGGNYEKIFSVNATQK